MANTKTLPIYREAQTLFGHLVMCTRKAPRDLRHTIVQRLLDEALEIIVDIHAANRATERRPEILDQLMHRIDRTDALLAVAMETRCISVGASAAAMPHLDSLAAQATGWHRAATKTPVTADSQSQPHSRDELGVQ